VEASTSLAEVTADFSDDQLREMARPPADRLFPLLRHASAMRPLVVLAAILPGLLALHGGTLDRVSSRMNLRTLDLKTALPSDLLQIESSFSTLLFQHTAPLTSWLQVVWLDFFGTEFHLNYLLTQLISAAAIIGLSFTLGHRLGGMRMGLFSSILICCQPQMLWSAQSAGFGPFPTAMVLISLWSVHKLWEEQISSLSLTQVLAGTSAAFCALSGGPMILALASCLILNRCAWDGLLWIHDHSPATRNKRRRVFLRGWKSLAMIGLYVLVLAGWWYAWMLTNFGAAFVSEWFQPWLGCSETVANIDWGPPVPTTQFFPGIMSGLVLIGFVQGIRELFGKPQAERENRRSECVWLLSWAGTAGVFWGIAEYAVRDCPAALEIWRLFLIVPITMLAAWGVVEIADRRVPLKHLFAYAVFSVIVSLLQSRNRWGDRAYLFQTATLVMSLIAISPILVWKLLRWSKHQDRRERQILCLVTLSLVGLTMVDGLSTVNLNAASSAELRSLSRDLDNIGSVDRLVFASRSSISPELVFIVRSRWPEAAVNHVSDWNSGMSNIVQHRVSTKHNTGELLICWDIAEASRFKDLQNPVIVVPAVGSRIFRDRELNVFLCETTVGE